jgi:hypothetical protein
LSYHSSSLLEPGWDISYATEGEGSAKGHGFMANYGLGSPYPEDSMLCSALGAYWPGAAPDITQFFPPGSYPIMTPITDRVADRWGGAVTRPKVNGSNTIEYQTLAYADFVKAIYEGRFNYNRFARVTLDDYILRTEITARFFSYLERIGELKSDAPTQRMKFVMTSFRDKVTPPVRPGKWTDPLNETFRIEFARQVPRSRKTNPHGNPRVTLVKIGPLRVVYIGPSQVAHQGKAGKWNVLSPPL